MPTHSTSLTPSRVRQRCALPADPSRLPAGKESRLVGTVGLSFHRDTREEFSSLQPPDGAAYLSNMAVDPAFRRWAPRTARGLEP